MPGKWQQNGAVHDSAAERFHSKTFSVTADTNAILSFGAALRPTAYKLQLFGLPQLAVVTGDVFPISKRARGILCYLALARDHKASRERLCSLFWPDRGMPQARASLRQTLLEVRKLLPLDGPNPLIADRAGIALDPTHVLTDLEAAETAGSAPALLTILQGISADPFGDLPAFGPGFDAWRAAVRPLVEARLRAAVLDQIEAAQATSDHAAVIDLADAWAVRDPIDEAVAAHAVRAEILTDARLAAERRYRLLSNRLESERGAEPDPELFALLRASKAASLQADPAPAAAQVEPAAAKNRRRALRMVPRQYAAALIVVVLLGMAYTIVPGWMRPPAPAGKPVVAVLPFKAVNGGADDTIFAEGLAEEIMNGLAEDERISVLGRATALRLGTAPALRSAARKQLGATLLLTGSLKYGVDGSMIDVRVNLVDSLIQTSRWATTVRLAATDVSSAEHQIVDLVTRELLDEPKARQPLSGAQAKMDAGAYRRIVLARRHILSREGDRLIEARELARQAIEIAPQWAEAHAVRSTAASLMQNYTDMPVAPLQAEASAAAARAIALDPALSAAHEAQSFALESVNPEQAMRAARRAVQLRPAGAEVRRRLAWLLRADGQLRQAAAELEVAIRIDPLWYLPYIDLGMSLYQMNQPAKMIAWQGRHAALEPLADERDLVLANMLLDTERAGNAAPLAARLVQTNPDLTYASLTWIDSMLALYAADAIPDALFELNSPAALVALARHDLAGAADQSPDGAAPWDDAEAAVIIGYALMANGQPDRLRTLATAHYPNSADLLRRMPKTLALGRHPGLYLALASTVAGDIAGAKALRQRIASDVTRLEQHGLALSQAGVTVAALAMMDGKRAAALDRLESTMAAQWSVVCHGPIWVGSDPLFRGLAGHPRFEALQKRCKVRLDQQRAAAGLRPISRL